MSAEEQIYQDLCKVLKLVHGRFTYASDIEQYNKREHWISFGEVPSGDFKGDCEDFAQAVRKQLFDWSYPSRLATCGVNSNKVNHCVVICKDWVLDNIHAWPMKRSDLINYNFIAMSGYEPGDPWREIK